MKIVFQESYKQHRLEVESFIKNFNTEGVQFGNAKRNSIKLFELDGETINIKSFKIPNLINKIAYNFFRKSKAQRSFEYANKLMNLGVGTPKPIAFFENSSVLFFGQSFYVSEHLDSDLTFRELSHNPDIPDHDETLRAFTRFTFMLHEAEINFLDHSPGNTLIKKVGDDYEFYLVDLNRMEFKTMDFEDRMKNFSRLTPHKSIVKVISDEYSKCTGIEFDKVFDRMWFLTEQFQEKFHKKRRLKKKLKFWKSN